MFDLPISVTNEIPEQSNGGEERVECPFLENVLLPPEEIERGTDTLPAQPFLGGGVSISGTSTGSSGSGSGESEGEGDGSSGSGAGSGGSGGSGGKEGDGDLTALLAEGSGRVTWNMCTMLLVAVVMCFML